MKLLKNKNFGLEKNKADNVRLPLIVVAMTLLVILGLKHMNKNKNKLSKESKNWMKWYPRMTKSKESSPISVQAQVKSKNQNNAKLHKNLTIPILAKAM